MSIAEILPDYRRERYAGKKTLKQWWRSMMCSAGCIITMAENGGRVLRKQRADSDRRAVACRPAAYCVTAILSGVALVV